MSRTVKHCLTRRASVALGAAMFVAGLSACTSLAAGGHASIWVNWPKTLADQAIVVRVTGLAGDQRVTVAAQTTDAARRIWRSEATFTASPDGEVNLASDAPSSGSYRGVNGMGLFWSMDTIAGEYSNEYFTAAQPQSRAGFLVRLTVTSGGCRLATRTISRDYRAPGETASVLSLQADKVSGVLFTPPPGTPRHPAVLVFGGAEGGMSQTFTAALLAAHGYPALTVAYFDWPGLPFELHAIPLEYFTVAGQILARQPGTDPAHILVMGYSRGTEAALLLADNFPQLFHGAIVYSPSSEVNPAQIGGQWDYTQPAWTLDGRGVVAGPPIPVSDVSGPVLAFAGNDDAIWGSGPSADQIDAELAGSRYPYQAVIYPGAGHGVGTFPYEPIGSGALQAVGGTRAGDVAAQRDSWAKVLRMLARLSG
jgi:dienelactone hydrolase